MVSVRVVGRVVVRVNGKVVHCGENMVVSLGHELIAGRLESNGVPKPSHMACGVGRQVTTPDMTSLSAEKKRVALFDVTLVGATISFTGSFTGVSGSISEFGLFGGSAGDSPMYARFTCTPFSVELNDEFDVVWSLSFGE